MCVFFFVLYDSVENSDVLGGGGGGGRGVETLCHNNVVFPKIVWRCPLCVRMPGGGGNDDAPPLITIFNN